MVPDILIYDDYIHNNGILHHSLCNYYGHERVGLCDAQDIVNGCLNEHIHLFVMPGGADLYYCEKLHGKGNQHIRYYVEEGGNYLGICAGAYYACREIEWGKGTEQEIIGPRELNFVDCLAVGPVYEFIQNGDINQSWNNVVELQIETGQEKLFILTTYSGGPVFRDMKGTKILGRFKSIQEQDAAILEQTVGNGRVILTSTHPEMTPENFEKSHYRNNNAYYDYESEILKKFQQSGAQISFLPFLLDRFNVPAQ